MHTILIDAPGLAHFLLNTVFDHFSTRHYQIESKEATARTNEEQLEERAWNRILAISEGREPEPDPEEAQTKQSTPDPHNGSPTPDLADLEAVCAPAQGALA